MLLFIIVSFSCVSGLHCLVSWIATSILSFASLGLVACLAPPCPSMLLKRAPLARVFFPTHPLLFAFCLLFGRLPPPASSHNSLDLESRGGVPGWSCIVCLGLPQTHVGWACVEQEGTRSERRPGDSYCPFPTDMTVFVEGKATRKVFLSWRTLEGSTEKL